MEKEYIKVVLSESVLERLGKEVVILIDIEQLGNNQLREEQETESQDSIFDFMEKIIAEKTKEGHSRTADNYRATLRRIKEFFKNRPYRNGKLTWNYLTIEIIEEFEKHLEQRKITKNTISFYLRILRAASNRAHKEGYKVSERLFSTVYTGKEKTKKRALPASLIRRVAKTETLNDKEMFARDMFIFSFITRGMSMVDIAHLTDSNIQGKRLSYKRSKTGQALSMEYLPEMKSILNRWRKTPNGSLSPYLFPLLEYDKRQERDDYKRAQQRINNALKKLGKRLGLPINLTMYVARHSWASLAKAGGVSTTVIGDALGHSSENTTKIYLDSLSENRIDEANRRVIRMTLG